MAQEYLAICKDCGAEFGYSEASLAAGSTRGLTRPERCPGCRRHHSKESRAVGAPQIKARPRMPRRPDRELQPGRLGKVWHPERPHRKTVMEAKFGRLGSSISFGITDDDIRRLIEAMQRHQVTVVVGPTGSGKSTFLPYRLMVPPAGVPSDVFTRYGQIAVTQPRKQATRNIARFVARDLHGSSLGAGFDVGFRHQDAPMSDWRNKLVYLTDGTLINWIISGQISNLSVIMIDEAHERSLNIDLILGLLKLQLPRFPQLRLIIASATINARLFQDYYGGPDKVPLLSFRGMKQHRVDAYFPFYDNSIKDTYRVAEAMADRIKHILLEIAEGRKPEGDILGFLPGEGEIKKCIEALNELIRSSPALRQQEINVYPLYAQLPLIEQDKALAPKAQSVCNRVMALVTGTAARLSDCLVAPLLDRSSAEDTRRRIEAELLQQKIDEWSLTLLPPGQTWFDRPPRQVVITTFDDLDRIEGIGNCQVVADRRVVIATNIAETSLTVDGIVYVVDSGLIKEANWRPEFQSNDLKPVFHSRAGCRQRFGRAGRVRDGEAHPLYSDEKFEDEAVFSAHTVPEIQRSSLEQVVLKAKAAGIGDIKGFDWIQRPPEVELQRAPAALANMGALDAEGDLTAYGSELQTLANDIPVADLMIAADRFACAHEMATFAAMSFLRVAGGMLLADDRWDFATRQEVESIQRKMASSCRDDLDFWLKIYSLWSEPPETRSAQICRRFFINAESLANRMAPAREKLIELLSVGKKTVEDRTVIFGELDRLRLVLAWKVPAGRIHRVDSQGRITSGDACDGKVKFEIDPYSVLAQNPPKAFMAFSRRMVRGRDDSLKVMLCGIVRLEEKWLQTREASEIELAQSVNRLLTEKRASENLGKDRHRIWLDVSFPEGARFRVRNDSHGSMVPGELLSMPPILIPVFTPDSLEASRPPAPDIENDADALAGWDDKDDSRSPSDPGEDEWGAGCLPVAEPSDDRGEGGLETKTDSGEHDATKSHAFSSPDFVREGLIVAEEVVAANLKLPVCRWLDGQGASDACEVVGHDFSDLERPVLLFKSSTSEPNREETEFALADGTKVQVEGVAVVSDAKGKKALRVREKTSGVEYWVDLGDLFFDRSLLLIDELLGFTFEMAVQYRQGARRLTRLPLVEEALHRLWRTGKKNLCCKLLEVKRKNDLSFKISEPGLEAVIEGAYMRRHDEDKTVYKVGQEYSLFLNNNFGRSYADLPAVPEGLIGVVEAEKFRSRVFWEPARCRLHVREPMNTRLLNILLAVSESFDYRSRIHRLYRRSNQIRVCNREGRGPLETDDHGFSKEEETESLAPDYKPGERVRGRVSAVYEKKVRVDLEKGGAGFIDLSHLSWKKILDPREVVYPGQAIEPQVIQMHKDARGRLQIDLSLLNPDDFPSCKYSSGKILDVDVVHVQQDFALCELEPGIAGILGPSNVRHHPIEDMRELFETGERIKARIVYMRLNPIDPKSPAKMDLSVKNSFKASVPIPEDMIGVVIGKGGQTIQKLKVESDCGIRVDGDRCCAEIVSWRQENIERAAELIRKLTERKVAVKPEMRTGSEKENIKTSSAAPHQVRRLVKIPVGTIGRLIGKKASMIKQIREIADAAIWCEENGLVKISGRRERNVRKAIDLIRRLIPEMEEAD